MSRPPVPLAHLSARTAAESQQPRHGRPSHNSQQAPRRGGKACLPIGERLAACLSIGQRLLQPLRAGHGGSGGRGICGRTSSPGGPSGEGGGATPLWKPEPTGRKFRSPRRWVRGGRLGGGGAGRRGCAALVLLY
ncbi:hypothetical protein NN561_016784 [Cricetulus griseus]